MWPSETLAYLPGGAADYARAVRIYTTLPLSPEELHMIPAWSSSRRWRPGP